MDRRRGVKERKEGDGRTGNDSKATEAQEVAHCEMACESQNFEMSNVREVPDEQREEQIINEEYKIWKKNTPFLYELVMTHALEWPSLTIQWLPGVTRPDGADFNVHTLIMGTHTSGDEQNYLMVADVRLPVDDMDDAGNFDADTPDNETFNGIAGKVTIKTKFPHEGEVHRARHCPKDPSLIATKSPNTEVFVFCNKEVPDTSPAFRCQGHSTEGWAVCWNPHENAQLISGSDDALICHWDLREGKQTVGATNVMKSHDDVIEDLSWHCKDPNIFGSVSDDRSIYIWDLRQPSKPCNSKLKSHSKEVNSISFNPFAEYLLATGSSDNTVALWDTRKFGTKVHEFRAHKDEVFQVEWHTAAESILASCGADRRVLVWDMKQIGKEQSEEDAEDGPPELMFVHGGHTNKISDFSWNATETWYVASVAEDNILQVWNMAESIYNGDEEEDSAMQDSA